MKAKCYDVMNSRLKGSFVYNNNNNKLNTS